MPGRRRTLRKSLAACCYAGALRAEGVAMKRQIQRATVVLLLLFLPLPAHSGDANDLGGTDLGQFGNLAIVEAASRNETEMVQAALLNGRGVDVRDELGFCALTYAAKYGNAEIARMLLDHGASPLLADKLGNLPIHWAAQQGSIDVMRLLVGAHSPVDATNREGLTPLMMAAKAGKASAVRYLLQSGADAGKQDYTGRDALGWATQPAVRQILSQAVR
jgi:uncharacterized protein